MLRIGDRDAATGLYWVIDEANTVLGLGKKEFNEVAMAGDRVIGQLRADGIWVLVGRDAAPLAPQQGKAPRPATHDKEPIYRRLDKFNSPEEEGGDYNQLRISITNQNISFGGFAPSAPPQLAAPVHCDIRIGSTGPFATYHFPGISTTPTPIIFSGSQPIAWLWGELEPPALFAWRRIVLVINLRGARAAGLGGTKIDPLILEIRHRIQSGEASFYPPVPASGSPIRRGAPRSIWRVGFARKSDGRYITIPAQNRSPEWLDLFSGNGNIVWHTGLPARLGRPPQAHARSGFTFQENAPDVWHLFGDTRDIEVSRFILKWPTYTIDTLAPSSVPSGRGFLIDYLSAVGLMVPENPALYAALGVPVPSTGFQASRTLRTILLPRPRPKLPTPKDPAFALTYQHRYPEYHSFPSP